MSPLELYEATRGFWVVGPRRERVELALAVYQGIVREVYRIRAWYPAGTLDYQTRDAVPYRGGGRWEFEGEIAEDVRADYIDRSVGKGGQNPLTGTAQARLRKWVPLETAGCRVLPFKCRRWWGGLRGLNP